MRHGNIRLGTSKHIDIPPGLPAFVIARDTAPWYSYDGINWTEGTGTPSAQLYTGAFGNGVYVFAGNGNNYLISEDGINWEVITGGSYGVAGANGLEGLVFSKKNQKFYVRRGTLANATQYILSSPDGRIWTLEQTLTVPSGVHSSLIEWDDGIAFSAATTAETAAEIWASANGNDFSSVASLGTTVNNRPKAGVGIRDKGFFINRENNNIWRSSNISTYGSTAITQIRAENTNHFLGYSEDLDRIIYTSNNVYYYSDDEGLTWTACTGISTPNSSHRIRWSTKANKFVSVNGSSPNIWYSSTGAAWTVISNAFAFNVSAIIAV